MSSRCPTERHRRTPATEHGDGADAGTEVLGIGGVVSKSLGCRAEQQVVDHRPCSDRRFRKSRPAAWRIGGSSRPAADRPRGHRPGPVPPRALALGAMTVAARVVGDPAVAAILTALDMATEGSQAAVLNGRHHLELAEAHMPGRWLGARRPRGDGRRPRPPPRGAHRRRATLRVWASPQAAVRAGRAGWSRCGSLRIVVLATRV